MRKLLIVVGLTALHAWAEKPNIIFFIADDMLPRHFNCLPEGIKITDNKPPIIENRTIF